MVLGSVLEGSQLGQVWEVLLSRPGRRQDSEQPLEVVRKDLEGTENRGTAWGWSTLHGGGTGTWPWWGGPTWL